MIRLLSLVALFGLGTVILSCDKCKTIEVLEDCLCIEIYAPVCGCDNVTYSNSCHAECAGIEDYEEGECGLL